MLAPARVTLPKLVTVDPRVTTVLPIVALEFWRLALVTAIATLLALVI